MLGKRNFEAKTSEEEEEKAKKEIEEEGDEEVEKEGRGGEEGEYIDEAIDYSWFSKSW